MENNTATMFAEDLRCKHSVLQAGDVLSETQYYTVQRVTPDGVDIINERGFPFHISKGIVEEGMFASNQYGETVEVTRTQLIEIFSQVKDTVFEVCYLTQPKADDINEAIESANKGKIIPVAELKKVVKETYKGKERILTGYLISTETGFGRSLVIDLKADKGTNPNHDGRIRQVDHRTLIYLIHKNVKYVVKKR